MTLDSNVWLSGLVAWALVEAQLEADQNGETIGDLESVNSREMMVVRTRMNDWPIVALWR